MAVYDTDRVREYALTEDGITIVAARSHSRWDGVLDVATLAGADLGGGTLSVLVSYEAEPDVEEAGHWSTVEGLGALASGYVYRVQTRAPTVAVALTSSSEPAITVRVA